MLNSQPQNGLVEIDWNNPITRGLVFAYIPGIGEITRHTKTINNPRGVAGRLGLHTAPLNAAPYPEFGSRKITTLPFSVIVAGTFASASSFIAPLLSHWPGGNGGWKFGVDAAGNIGYTHFGIADYSTSVMVAGFTGVIGISGGSNTTARFFKGGEFRQAVAVGGLSLAGSSANYSVGSRSGTTDAVSTSTVSAILHYERHVTDLEQASLAANIWQIILDEDDEDEVLFSQVVAGGGVNGSGSITLGAIGVASAGTATVAAASASTLGGIATSGAAAVRASGTSATTLGGIAVSAAAASQVQAASTTTLGGLSVAGAGTVSPVGTNGSASITLGAISTAGAGNVKVSANSATTLGGLAVAGAGTSPAAGTNASANITMGALVASGVGAIRIAAQAAPPIGALVVSGNGVTLASVTDAASVSPSRTVVFAGGVRVVKFHGGIRTVRF